MALQKINVGTNEDGSARTLYVSDKTVLITGPISGVVETADGQTIDVTPDVIEVDSPEQAYEVSHLIGVRHEDEGHPEHDADEPFAHLCTDACGDLKRADDDPMQALALERATQQRDNATDEVAQEQLAALVSGTAAPQAASATPALEEGGK